MLFKFEKTNVCVVVAYGPSEGTKDAECLTFLNKLNGILDRMSRVFRVIVLGGLIGWIGDQTRNGITGAFGVAGKMKIVKR